MRWFILFIACLGLVCELKSETFDDSPKVVDEKSLNLSIVTLKNGMRICLKPTNFESDEVMIKVAALGGYGSLPATEYASGKVASQIAWESGMGNMSSDQVSAFLYEHCLEFYPKIHPFSRTIEGSSTKEGLEFFLKCIHTLFTNTSFTQEGFNIALAQAKASLIKKLLDFEHIYEAEFLATNTQNFKLLQTLTLEELDKVNFETSKEFFKNAFSNPKDFSCVIVGSFKNEEVEPLIKKYLESIPVPDNPYLFKKPQLPVFPKGITLKEIPVSVKKDSLTRLTFPLTQELAEDNLYLFEFACQLIEARLRHVITEEMKTSYGIDVAYEFPIYPFLNSPWMTIQFRSESKLTEKLIKKILNELKNIKSNGVTRKEVDEIKKLELSSDGFWLQDNHYWVSALTNYYLWSWNLENIQRDRVGINFLSSDVFNTVLKSYFNLENYSIVTTK